MALSQSEVIVACSAAFVLYVCGFLWFIYKTNQVTGPLASDVTLDGSLNAEAVPVNYEQEPDL